VGYAAKTAASASTWSHLAELFEAEMERVVANKDRNAQREEGTMAESTRNRYRLTLKAFSAFLAERRIQNLDQITKFIIASYKEHRLKQILALKQSRGGGSVALEVAILHRILAFAIESGLLAVNPITLKHEAKPGKKPVNGARSFTATELAALREHAGQDLFTLLLLRWTGLRGSDAVNLRWRDVHFDRGVKWGNRGPDPEANEDRHYSVVH
jgi:integrase